MSERLAKFMARSGVCSRRRAEEYIRQKRVTVNGEIVDSPAFNVEGTEKILFDGEKLPEIETTRLWLYSFYVFWKYRFIGGNSRMV